MRTGPIFATGNCRTLKWMALFSVVSVLGAATAAAQITVTTPKTVSEGGRLIIEVTAEIDVPTSQTNPGTITITPTVTNRTPDGAETAGGLTVAETDDYDVPRGVLLTLDVEANTGSETVSRTLTDTLVLQMKSDLDAEDEAISISYAIGGASGARDKGGSNLTFTNGSASANVTIEDPDTQTFTWGDTASAKEGGNFVVTLKADPPPVDLTYVTRLSIDDRAYALDHTSHTFDASDDDANISDGPTATITVTPPNSDGNRDADTITLWAIVAGTNDDLVDPLTVEVADIHALPEADAITAQAFTVDEDGKTDDEAASVTEGGDPVVVTVTVDRGTSGYPDGEKLNVAVSARDSSQRLDYRVDLDKLVFDPESGKETADFTLWALNDDDVGAEDLVLSLVATGDKSDNGPGQVESMFSISIVDDTTRLVSAKDGAYDAIMAAMGDDPLTPGSVVELMTDDLFEYGDMVDVSIAASSDGSAVSAAASGDVVTLTAASAGEAKVTVTATATPRGGSLTVTQERANVVQLTFPVTVELAALSISLAGPDDVNLVEGMSYAITAEANRAVTEDTVVDLVQTDGTASPADYEVGSITIASGETSGSAMLMVVDDGESDSGTGSPETLTLEGRVGSMKTNALTFHLWDAAVPALPLVAQLLLAALLGLGGYRRYRRR